MLKIFIIENNAIDIKKSAKEYTKEIIDGSSIDNMQKHIKKVSNDTHEGAEKIFDKSWPIIKKVIFDELIEVAEKSFNNDEVLESVFSAAYEVMPTPFRLIVSRGKFITFCMNRKKSLVKELPDYKSETRIANKINTKDIGTDFENSNTIEYEDIIPELISFCIVADGTVEESEIILSANIITNDELIKNKDLALERLSLNIEKHLNNKGKSEVLYKLYFASLISKIATITDNKEIERINIIMEGMMGEVSQNGVGETRKVVNAIKENLNEVEFA